MTELKPTQHKVRPNTVIVEVWIDGQFAATITPMGPTDFNDGIRIVSKHPKQVHNQLPLAMNIYIDKNKLE